MDNPGGRHVPCQAKAIVIVVPGFLGAYPNVFLVVNKAEIDRFEVQE
jgi:hypothetical protein